MAASAVEKNPSNNNSFFLAKLLANYESYETALIHSSQLVFDAYFL